MSKPYTSHNRYLHNNDEFVEYWKKYFDEYPLEDDDRFEIYIDFPFCRSVCKFCVFGSNLINEHKDHIHEYEDAVVSLIQDMKDVFPNRVNNIYFGGGTPTLWSRESLLKIKNSIPTYDSANTRTIECHPIDLTEEYLMFLINDMNIKTVSIGVQSFDHESNIMQNRIPGDIEKIKNAIQLLHDHDRYVNIDVVALFNYDNEKGWDIFREDLRILLEDLQPDDICSSPNFRVPDYYNKSIIYRNILKDVLNKYPKYTLEHSDSISTDIIDIVRYGEEPYHLRTKEYHEFFNVCRVGIMDSNPDVIKNNIVIGFGGSVNGHSAISRLGKIKMDISSGYSFERHRMRHIVTPTTIVPPYNGEGAVPTIKIGNCTIDSNI